VGGVDGGKGVAICNPCWRHAELIGLTPGKWDASVPFGRGRRAGPGVGGAEGPDFYSGARVSMGRFDGAVRCESADAAVAAAEQMARTLGYVTAWAITRVR
jgi:hypothetical protein